MTNRVRFEVRPLGAVGAAEIVGLDCALPLDDERLRALRTVFVAHPLLVIRDQRLTPPQQHRFTAQLGPVEEVFQKRFRHPDDANVLILTNELNPDGSPIGVVDAGDFQHSDGQPFALPTLATILYSVRNPRTE
jgi:alpha-ketoglutarate-dependent taurine dioxygenase